MKLEIPNNIKIQTYKTYSFGTFEEIKEMMTEAYKIAEPNLDFKWLNFYDKIASWMSDTKGSWLGIVRDDTEADKPNNGLGKSIYLNYVFPILLWSKFKTIPLFIDFRNFTEDEFNKIMLDGGQRILLIDEIGREPVNLKFWGTDIDPVDQLFSKAEKQKWLIIFVGNVTKKQMSEKYSNASRDRFKNAFFIEISGESKRIQKSKLF